MKSRWRNLTSVMKGAGLMAFALVAILFVTVASPHQASAAPPPVGTFTTLYSFCQQTDCTDGYYPYSGVTVTSAGTISAPLAKAAPATSAPSSR